MDTKKYVEASKLISEFNKQCMPDVVTSAMFYNMVHSLPGEDVVKVVRCKNCMNYINKEPKCFCKIWRGITEPSNFCGFGV